VAEAGVRDAGVYGLIKLAEPNLTGKETEYVTDAIFSGHVGTDGQYVERFEAAVAKATGREWCIATSSGTAAIHLALEVLSVPKVVSLPSYTFGATLNAVLAAGAEPYFIDIHPIHWTARNAVLSVETFGQPTISDAVVDAAASIGRGKIGGRVACLSFNANKTITTGGGGALVGDGGSLLSKALIFSKQGKIGKYEYIRNGMNYRMPNINAALGLAQIERLDEFVSRKREIAQRYYEVFGQSFPNIERGSCWMSGVQVEDAEQTAFVLGVKGIEACRMWKPLHLQTPWRRIKHGRLEGTNRLWRRILALPSSTGLTEGQQDEVILACRGFIKTQ